MNKNKTKKQQALEQNIAHSESSDPNVIEFEKHAQMQKEQQEQEQLQAQQIQQEQTDKKQDKTTKSKASRAKIAVASLVFLLAVGVGGNWYFENSGIAGKIEPILSSQEIKTLGEAEFVDATTVDTTTENKYFSTARVERQTARDEALEKLQAIIDSTDADTKAEEKAAEEIAKISNYISIENKIETLVTSKGVDNCLAVVSSDGSKIDIIVDVEELSEQTIIQIKDIAIQQLNCSFEDVSIIQSK